MKHLIAAVIVTAIAVAVARCSSYGPAGSTVTGPLDQHCSLPDGGTRAQVTDFADCHPDGGDVTTVVYGPTLYNAEGDDDECKYHLKFSSSGIYENQDVNFTAMVTRKTDGMPAPVAKTSLEVFLNDMHPAPNSGQKSTENPAGTYRIGPIHFDAAGQWRIRFHIYEECSELLETSPHGHVAFYIAVP